MIFTRGQIMKLSTFIDLMNKNQQLSITTYSIYLEKTIKEICHDHQIKIFEETISPIATRDFNWEAALNLQCFEIEINTNKKKIITCNPYNQQQYEKYKNWEILITKPDTYIYYLSKQLCQNGTEGIFKLIHFYATKNNINDIHICHEKQYTKIQFPSKSQHKFTIYIDPELGKRLTHFIKLNSNIDPSVTNQPQNGAYKFINDNIMIEIRTSTLPIFSGEMISLRLFNKNKHLTNFEKLGFSSQKIHTLHEILTAKHGLILITGPTGSGKSTTLYTILQKLKSKHVISIEDPIEQVIDSIHQTNINELQSFTLETAFKAALRHNPDVIAIGEIRDKETAEVVLNAAYSGHLVIASLHTNNIESTLLRLANLGCNPFMISYCLRGIISQELTASKNSELILTSKILHCKKPYIIHNIKEELTKFLNHHILI